MTRVTVIGLSLALVAADWPGFRGDGTAVSPEPNLPVGFNLATGEGLRWKAELPARGVSSPAVVGDRVYVTCSDGVKGDRLHVLAFDAGTGKRLWHRQLAATGPTACHPKTCMAAPTPVADATGVYALFATGDLAAFDRDGALRWYRSLPTDYPGLSNQVGMAASPVLAAGRLIVPMDNTVESFVAGLDTATGANVWRQSRPKETGWLTPCVRTGADGKQAEHRVGSAGDRDGDRENVVDDQRGARGQARVGSDQRCRDPVAAAAGREQLDDLVVRERDDEDGDGRRDRQVQPEVRVVAERLERFFGTVGRRRESVGAETHPCQEGHQRQRMARLGLEGIECPSENQVPDLVRTH